MPDKLKQILNFTVPEPLSSIENTVGSSVVEEEYHSSDFPAGRSPAGTTAVKPAERTLTANMTGLVTLTGYDFDLHFSSGHLKKISRNSRGIFDKMNCITRFETSERKIGYTTESAFAFDGEKEYGLRTLQIPQKIVEVKRVYTDFTFNRESGGCYIICTIEYPEFSAVEKVRVSAPMELRLRLDNREAAIKTEKSGDTFSPGTDFQFDYLEGKSFEIAIENKVLNLSFQSEYNSRRFTVPGGLAIGIDSIRRRRFLMLNPFGNYRAAPSEYYNGITEQFCLKIDIGNEPSNS